jgi:hypothetical protein
MEITVPASMPGPRLRDASLPAIELRVAARCEDVSQTMRFLTGVVMATQGQVLSRRVSPDGAGEMEFAFPRLACVEIYCVLIAAGLELSGSAHRLLTTLCQCTRERVAEVAGESAVLIVRLAGRPQPGLADEVKPAGVAQEFLA